MKKRFAAMAAVGISILAGFLFSCDLFGPDAPDNRTMIVFDNSRGISSATVYSDSRRREQDVVAREVSPGQSSAAQEWPSGESTFYFSYQVGIRGISDFSFSYVPSGVGAGQRNVRIDEGERTNITVPSLEETVASQDQLLTNDSFLFIQNNSSISFQLHRGSAPVNPDGSISSLVNVDERAQYTINPAVDTNFSLLINSNTVPFPPVPVFEKGHIYRFALNADRTLSLTADTAIILANVGITTPDPPRPQPPGTPGTPTFRLEGNRMFTVSWYAVQGAERYELYVSTTTTRPDTAMSWTVSTSQLMRAQTGWNVYYIWVRAVNSGGPGGFSPYVRVTVPN